MKPQILKKFRELLTLFNPPSYVIKEAKSSEGIDGHVVTYNNKNSYIAEQYKILRTNLYSLSQEKPIKTLMITSAQSGEGKTVTSCNLAFTISLDTEKKVLLIDVDLRKPSVHKMFNIPRKPGFSDIIMGKVDYEYFLEKPSVGNLHIIPAGAMLSNPSEVLISAKIKNFIDRAKLNFDYIICDTPPVINVTDASILGSLCDCVVLVVKLGVSQKDVTEEAFNLLKDAQSKPKAFVLVNAEMPSYFYYSRYKYYYKYGYGKK